MRSFLIHTGQDLQIWPSLPIRLGPLDVAFTSLVIRLLTSGHLPFKVILSNGRSSILLHSPASCGVIHGRERKFSFTATIRQPLISESPTSCTLSAPYFSVVLLTISQSSSLTLLVPITQLPTLYPICRWCGSISSPQQRTQRQHLSLHQPGPSETSFRVLPVSSHC